VGEGYRIAERQQQEEKMAKEKKRSPRSSRGNGGSTVTVPKDDQPAVLQACRNVDRMMSAGMANRRQYLRRENAIMAEISSAVQERDALLKMVCAKLGIKEDWILMPETMTFRPPGAPVAALGLPRPDGSGDGSEGASGPGTEQ
jgi:hypothetical protein